MPEALVFGRDPARANVVLAQDKKVSGVHARLTFDGTTMRIEDCGSTNGTFFNENQRLKPNTPYKVRKGVAFFLVSPKNTYIITED